MQELLEFGLITREQSPFGATLNYGSKNYPCSMGTAGFGGRLTDGGISPGTEVLITIRKSVLDPCFKVGQFAAVTDSKNKCRELKIAQNGIRDCIFAWEINFVDRNQNA